MFKRENFVRALALFGIYFVIVFILFFTVFSFMFTGGESRMERDVAYLRLIMMVGVAWILGTPLFLVLGRSLKRDSDCCEHKESKQLEGWIIFYCTWVIYCVAVLISMSVLSLNINLGK